MQYLLTVIADQPGATAEEMAAIDVFNQGLKDDGHWVYANGLALPEAATVVDNRPARDGDILLTDGPFLESKEFLAGFYIIEADDLDVALKLGAGASKACNRKIEVRPFATL